MAKLGFPSLYFVEKLYSLWRRKSISLSLSLSLSLSPPPISLCVVLYENQNHSLLWNTDVCDNEEYKDQRVDVKCYCLGDKIVII